jgi:hypothetical protein
LRRWFNETPQHGFLLAGKIVARVFGVGEQQINRQRLVIDVVDDSCAASFSSYRQGNPDFSKAAGSRDEIADFRACSQEVDNCAALAFGHQPFGARQVDLCLSDGMKRLRHAPNMPQWGT